MYWFAYMFFNKGDKQTRSKGAMIFLIEDKEKLWLFVSFSLLIMKFLLSFYWLLARFSGRDEETNIFESYSSLMRLFLLTPKPPKLPHHKKPHFMVTPRL